MSRCDVGERRGGSRGEGPWQWHDAVQLRLVKAQQRCVCCKAKVGIIIDERAALS